MPSAAASRRPPPQVRAPSHAVPTPRQHNPAGGEFDGEYGGGRGLPGGLFGTILRGEGCDDDRERDHGANPDRAFIVSYEEATAGARASSGKS
jgi:hypothetical protein